MKEGASLTAVMVIETVAVAVPPLPSPIEYVKESPAIAFEAGT